MLISPYSTLNLLIRAAILWSLVLIAACGGSADPPESNYKYTSPESSDDGIPVAGLQSKGIDPELFEDMVDYFELNKTHSALVAIDGDLVFEVYLPGYKYNGLDDLDDEGNEFVAFDQDSLHSLNSITKSVTSALVGIAIDQAFISGTDATIGEFYSDYSAVSNSPAKSAIPLDYVLSMTAGLSWDESSYPYDSGLNDANAVRLSDPYEYTLQRSIVSTPGLAYRYSGGLTTLLGGVIERTSGIDLDEFAELNLFGPLGITDYEWARDQNGELSAKGGLSLRPRDSLKFGQLFLNNGMWQGNQIVSESWVSESTSVKFPFNETRSGRKITGYGYQWWVNDFVFRDNTYTGYIASGLGGQMIAVIEDLNMVIVVNSGLYSNHRVPYEYITDYILPAVAVSQ